MSTQPFLPWDITAARHRGNPASIDANPAPESKRVSHAAIMHLVRQHGSMTSKQIAAELGRPLHCLSGRITELLQVGALERMPLRVDGAAVLRVKKP